MAMKNGLKRAVAGALGALVLLGAGQASAQMTGFKQAVAEAAARDADIAAFYRTRDFTPIWTDTDADDTERRSALLNALAQAARHGLPADRYDADALITAMQGARSSRDLGFLEVEMSRVFLAYARDIQTGALIPSRIDPDILREVPYRDRGSYLTMIAREDPSDFIAALPPQTVEYRALLAQKIRLEAKIAAGGWGPAVPASRLEPGDTGPEVVALRNRLIAMGYLAPTAKASYDSDLQTAVETFQLAHGLEIDGVAGQGTIGEINVEPQARLRSIIVAMERERWLNRERGERHILVNLADFHARIIDHGHETFRTRSVVGKDVPDQRSPEFSDVMEHMVVNPSWHVPRSIATKEYLPELQSNPNAVRHLIITDAQGRRVDRGAVDFSRYTTRSFPFAMRQPPGPSNALGLVKFMFPNPHNIYLHDTPHKHLFAREVRAYSHGCIRLADPFDFAYALLAAQTDDPEGYFQRVLKTGTETQINLDKPVPVHLIYRTALTNARGQIEYRRDVYGRDAKIWQALSEAGVVLPDVQG